MERPGQSILIVDDEPSIVEALAEILGHAGFAVQTAGHGRAALERLAAERPDLVLMDVMMPLLGGVDTVAAMRRDAALAEIPVVLMSAGPIPELARVETLRKPFTLEALLQAVHRALAAPAGGR